MPALAPTAERVPLPVRPVCSAAPLAPVLQLVYSPLCNSAAAPPQFLGPPWAQLMFHRDSRVETQEVFLAYAKSERKSPENILAA